jgi:hypothetical protein
MTLSPASVLGNTLTLGPSRQLICTAGLTIANGGSLNVTGGAFSISPIINDGTLIVTAAPPPSAPPRSHRRQR